MMMVMMMGGSEDDDDGRNGGGCTKLQKGDITDDDLCANGGHLS